MSEEKIEFGGERDIQEMLEKHYTNHYLTGDALDSPQGTRDDMIEILRTTLKSQTIDPPTVVEVGAGGQLLLDEFANPENDDVYKEFSRTKFITIEQAHLPEHRLAARDLSNVRHIEGDASKPHIDPGSAGLVIGNMCVDLMPEPVLAEVAAALSERGSFAFTLHHPETMRERLRETKDQSAATIIGFALERHYFYDSPSQIKEEFSKYGLRVNAVALHSDRTPQTQRIRNKWWLVTGFKK